MSKFSRVSDGVHKVLDLQLQKEREDAKEKFTQEFELDERMIELRGIQLNYPASKDIIEIAIREFRDAEMHKSNLPKGYLTWDEKQLINGRLELVRSDWEDYTLEELASLVR